MTTINHLSKIADTVYMGYDTVSEAWTELRMIRLWHQTEKRLSVYILPREINDLIKTLEICRTLLTCL